MNSSNNHNFPHKGVMLKEMIQNSKFLKICELMYMLGILDYQNRISNSSMIGVLVFISFSHFP